MIQTKTVVDRRKLRFRTIDEVLADVDRIVAADKAGTLRTTGNWTAGQALGHVAAWASYPYEGFPLGKLPWFVRVILRMIGKRILRKGMTPGVKIPKVPGGTFGIEVISTEEGAARLRAAFERMKRGEPAKYDSPAWGPMTDEDRIGLNLRHAELHLSFLHP
ncbi:MAG: hypothetical protein HBSAPP02_02160 [Phycisphaerae bacterium]|nr:MAG: DUF1569 domain-containing protein [Planctomycetia bacterium]RIK70258.1 MAG: hypothetical protein DCC66_05950 [Planctomycetota bacterium]GJQ25184.1 MAG: hypothetical protein HBSAPP02_02160 [Phycisphaerae bacterium]